MRRDPFSSFFEKLLLYGLEHFNKYYGSYRASIVDNNDPDNLGRVKIKCIPLYGTNNPDIWVFPRGSVSGNASGIYWIPPNGSSIYITCEHGNPRFPLWEYGWWLTGKTIQGAVPGVHIFQTPYGHRIELNDNDKFIDIKHPSGFHVKLVETGIYIGKDDKNLGKFMDDLFQLLTTTTVPTIYGASLFNNIADYTALRAEIAEFLKNS